MIPHASRIHQEAVAAAKKLYTDYLEKRINTAVLKGYNQIIVTDAFSHYLDSSGPDSGWSAFWQCKQSAINLLRSLGYAVTESQSADLGRGRHNRVTISWANPAPAPESMMGIQESIGPFPY